MKLSLHLAAVIIFLLLGNAGFSQQPCDETSLMTIKGSWKKETDANPFPDESFPKNQFAQVNSRIDKMQKILQAAYPEPRGIEAKWYRTISGKALVQDGPVPFEMSALFLAYYCNNNNNNTKELGGETDTWFYVWANQINWFAERVSYYTVNKQPVYLLTQRVGELNGSSLYMGIHNKNSNTGIAHSHAQIITRAGQSPYLSIKRKTFLQSLLKWNESQFKKNMEAMEKNIPVRTDAEEESYKKNQWAIIEKRTRPDRLANAWENFLKNYLSSSQQKENLLAKIKKDYENEIKPAQDFLANSSEAELAQPAIIDDLTGFKQFSTFEKGGRELVRLNPDYFDRKLPRFVPQFLIVYWRWDDHAAGKYFNKQVEEHFNFTALKEMIDK